MKNSLNYYNIKFSQKITLLVCAFLLCLIVTTMLNTLVLSITGADSMLYINISIITQNLLAFILPVIITAVFITPSPVKFMELDKLPSGRVLMFLICAYIAMTPALNFIVEWNKNISFPESMAGIESMMRNAENAALAVNDKILDRNNILLSILLVGCLTGLSEEVFFRGGLQKILLSRPMNAHIAIWLTAFIFSLMHFQFFGFVPRVLIGAFFGYLAWWSGSLWTAVIAHAINNSTVIVAHAINKQYAFNLDNLGVPQAGEFPWLAIASIIVTTILIIWYKKTASK